MILPIIKIQAQTDNLFLCIEHIGEGDNPLTSIFISIDDRLQGYDTIFVKVSCKEFKRIKAIVISNKDKTPKDPMNRNFGVYRITINDVKRLTVYFFETRDKSLSFLKTLREQIKSAGIINEKLDNELYLNIYTLQ